MAMAAALCDITRVANDHRLLGQWFADDSWSAWKVVLKAIYGLPLKRSEHAIFHQLAGDRPPPTKPIKELWVLAGRRAGKDSISSLIAVFISCFHNHADYLRPGERASIVCLANDKLQAGLVLRYIRAYFDRVPALHELVERQTKEGLELSTGAEIIVSTNDFKQIRGRTIALAILDECAFYVTDGAATDVESYNAIKPGMVTLPYSLLIGITTPYARRGLAYQKYQRHFGKDDPEVLVIQAPSRALNPTIDQSVVDAAIEQDPEAANAEWLGLFRADISGFVDVEVLNSVTDFGVFEIPPRYKMQYVGFVDVAGGSGGDSFTCAIAHREGEKGILDAIREFKPPFQPSAVVAETAELLKGYRIGSVQCDRWGSEFVKELFRNHGVIAEQSAKVKSDIYREFLGILNSRRCSLLDNKRLHSQMLGLERRVSRFGSAKEAIDHAPGNHDDIANSVAGAITMATQGRDFISTWLLAGGFDPQKVLASRSII
jgi:Terminase large subunit, ATPase domain